jgi:bacterioferritin
MSDFNRLFGKNRSVKASSVPVPQIPAASVSKEQFLQDLQGDLTLEYTAALQYLQHFAVMQGAQFDNIRQHLKEHAEEELGHASVVAERIVKLGGVPLATIAEAKVTPDAVAMLNQNLGDEKNAITRYKERIVQAMTLGEFGAADELMDILKDEEEHEQDLLTTLGNPSGNVALQEGAKPVGPVVEVEVEIEVPGHPGSGYQSQDATVNQLEQSREDRKSMILSKLAALKKA